MKKIVWFLCLIMLVTFVGCASEQNSVTPTAPATAEVKDNGAKSFLRGENPDFVEKFAE